VYPGNNGWTLEQSSIFDKYGTRALAYVATFTFREAGGAHTVAGHFLAQATQFRATQSKIGCVEGVGAKVCVPLCAKYGVDSSQLRAKCGFGE
jgi:hypothetical protein